MNIYLPWKVDEGSPCVHVHVTVHIHVVIVVVIVIVVVCIAVVVVVTYQIYTHIEGYHKKGEKSKR